MRQWSGVVNLAHGTLGLMSLTVPFFEMQA
jgi:hypothetical protein